MIVQLYLIKGFEQLGLNKPEDAIGKGIDFWGRRYTIVGVTENFHQQSLHEAFEPLIFQLDPDVRGYLSIKTPASNASETIALVKSNWDNFFPAIHSNISFLMIISINSTRLINDSVKCLDYLLCWQY